MCVVLQLEAKRSVVLFVRLVDGSQLKFWFGFRGLEGAQLLLRSWKSLERGFERVISRKFWTASMFPIRWTIDNTTDEIEGRIIINALLFLKGSRAVGSLSYDLNIILLQGAQDVFIRGVRKCARSIGRA